MKVIAHRGASGDALENSTSAIRQAAGMGVDAIEIDVRLTNDHQLIVNHDATLFNIANNPSVIRKTNLADLKQIKLHDGSPLLRLEDALTIANGKAMLIELKDKGSQHALFEVLDRFPHVPVTICSFILEDLAKIKQARPKLRCYALTATRPLKAANFANQHHLEGVGIAWAAMNPLAYRRVKKYGLRCYLWTVNPSWLGHWLNRWYPEAYICSNFPERFILKP